MPSCAAAFSALGSSRDAMAAISLHSPSCIAGITFFTAIPATPSTPHLTFCMLMLSPCGLELLARANSVRARRAMALLEFFFGANCFQVRDSIEAENSVQMIDFVLEQFGEISQLSGLNLVRVSL